MIYLRNATVTCVFLGVLIGGAHAVEASLITFQTRFSTAGPLATAAQYETLIEGLMLVAPTSGYCDAAPTAWTNVSNQVTCGGSATSIAFDISAAFTVSAAQTGTWGFRVGPDFGSGGALFLDGVEVAFNNTDMYWANSYSFSSEIFLVFSNLAAGNHVLEAYGLEPCCDGVQQAQFLAPGSTVWTTFSTTDTLDPAAVPEPATMALIAVGLASAGLRRRRRERTRPL